MSRLSSTRSASDSDHDNIVIEDHVDIELNDFNTKDEKHGNFDLIQNELKLSEDTYGIDGYSNDNFSNDNFSVRSNKDDDNDDNDDDEENNKKEKKSFKCCYYGRWL
eukprot:Pgem_evm2s1006